MYKNERYTKIKIHKDKLKMDYRLKFKTRTIKLLEKNIGRTLDINQSKILYDPSPRMEIKNKGKQMGPD